MDNAWDQLQKVLADDEHIEHVVFGAYGWGTFPENDEDDELGYNEEQLETPMPRNLMGRPLPPVSAKPLMQNWSIYGGYGAPECYAFYAWSNQNVYFVVQYDGSTSLNSVPRNPIKCKPQMPGG